MKPQALAPQTGRLIEAISRLECIKPFVLVGGTALSIQLKNPAKYNFGRGQFYFDSEGSIKK